MHYSDTAHYQPEDYVERIEGRASFYNRRLDEFEAMGLKPGSILEVGCTTGHFLSHARLRSWNPMGLEISPTMAKYGREKLNLEIVISDDIKKAGFSDQQFDVVYASNVLEHILDQTSFLFEVKRILKPKGTVFIEVPNQFRHLREVLKLLMYVFLSENYANKILPFPFDSIHHCYFFTPNTLKKILGKTGYKSLSISTYTPEYFRKEFFTLTKTQNKT